MRKLKFLYSIFCIVGISVFLTNNSLAADKISYDTTRIYKAMAKARNGEDIVIGVIGGSITQGYAASVEGNRWANLMADWWKSKFPGIKVTLVNAGIGGTGSDIGTFRVQNDLLKYKPDFTMAEFSVNDSEGEHAEKMMEGLLRQVLADTNYPGVMLLLLKQSNGTTAQASHKLVAEHYKVPYVSFADLIDSAVTSDGINLDNIFVDGLHPNDVGMAYIAKFIANELDSIYNYLPADNLIGTIDAVLPNPLITDTYAHTFTYNSSNIVPLSNKGWDISGKNWISETPGSEITFEVDGNSISILYSRHNYANGGRIEIWVDEGAHSTLDAYWDQTWGPATVFQLVQEGLSDGVHILHIKVLNEHDPATNGNYFKLLNVLKAGNIGSAAPIAVSGFEKKKVLTGNPIELEGVNSFDPDGDAIVSYSWSIVDAPGSSHATIQNANLANCTYTPDAEGYYKIGLTVNDGTLNSVKHLVAVHAVATNSNPIAVAGSDFTIATGKYAMLDGSQSYDSDEDSLSFSWELISKPSTSNASLIKYNTPVPMARLEKAGEYKFTLIVNDSLANSIADTITVTAIDGFTNITANDETVNNIIVYPIPSNGSLYIDYSLDAYMPVKISTYTLNGKLLENFLDQIQPAGEYHYEIKSKPQAIQEKILILHINIGNREFCQQIIYR